MKTILSFCFFAVLSVTAFAGVKTFPLHVPQDEPMVFACSDQKAAELVTRLASEDRKEDLNIIGPQLISQGICGFGSGQVTYVRQTLRIVTEHGLFTVYEAKVEGVNVPFYISMKDWEHAQS